MSQSPRLTPVDILNHSFRRLPVGYAVAEVDEFIRRVAGDMESLLTDAAVQRERLAGLERELAQYRAMEVALRDSLVMAQQSADETRASARRQAEAQLQEAQARMHDLEIQTRGHLEEANTQIDRLRQEHRGLVRDLRARLNAHLAWLDEETAAAFAPRVGAQHADNDHAVVVAPAPQSMSTDAPWDHGDDTR